MKEHLTLKHFNGVYMKEQNESACRIQCFTSHFRRVLTRLFYKTRDQSSTVLIEMRQFMNI